MTILSQDVVLVESRSAREQRLSRLTNDDATAKLQAQGLVMALWKGDRVATTAQIAEFYQVAEDTVQSFIKKHRDELESDGLKIVRGKDLRDVVSLFDTSSKAPSLTLWNPRAALRLGMLLRDSLIAKAVRTALLDTAEKAGEQAEELELTRLQLELERERNRGKELDSSMVAMHGVEIVLALRGKEDQIVRVEEKTVEVVEPEENRSVKILTADELKAQVQKRTGQKIKSLKQFADALRKAGRDDLLVPVRRHTVSEYITPDKLDEAIAVVFGANRQRLIGE